MNEIIQQQDWTAIPAEQFTPQPGMTYVVLFSGKLPFMAQYMPQGHWESVPLHNFYSPDSITHVVIPKKELYANLSEKRM
jgi:hypothetical protein